MSAIQVLKCGITDLPVEALVNEANESLMEGGRVCSEIYTKAGRLFLRDACKKIGHCDTGSAVVTSGYGLDAGYIIHAVGPIWRGGNHGEPRLLYSAYQKSMRLAMQLDCHSIGFPLLSTGNFGYPVEEAWHVAVQAVVDFLHSVPDYDMTVLFAVFDEEVRYIGEVTAKAYISSTQVQGALELIPGQEEDGSPAAPAAPPEEPQTIDPSVLEDGSVLLDLKKAYLEDDSEENLYALLSCLRDSEVVVPVSSDAEGVVAPDILQGPDRNLYFPVFSQEAQIPEDYDESSTGVRLPMLRCIRLAHESQGTSGLVLDAFTDVLMLPFELADLIPRIPSRLEHPAEAVAPADDRDKAAAEEPAAAEPAPEEEPAVPVQAEEPVRPAAPEKEADRSRTVKAGKKKARDAYNAGGTMPSGPMVFFWKDGKNERYNFLSQWYSCMFTVEGVEYNCMEQYMMAKKALVFHDIIAYHQIMAAADPQKIKELGRNIRPFYNDVWIACREEIVYNGNLAKFRQNPVLLEKLLETGSSVLAEASPFDRIWGIGLSASDPAARDSSRWRGQNLLGKALMEVRATLAEENGSLD